jgi:hypothetical protein
MGTGRGNESCRTATARGALDAELSMGANLSASTDRLMPYRRPSACPNCPCLMLRFIPQLFPWLAVSSSNSFVAFCFFVTGNNEGMLSPCISDDVLSLGLLLEDEYSLQGIFGL